ncbi:MAG: glutamine-hydrolyzing GMP synthase, partial [Kiritimatiellia bacterium]
MDHKNWIAVLDFGSQVTQLIARRIREQKVYCEILPCYVSAEDLQKRQPAGIVLSGGPQSVFGENAPTCDKGIFELGLPILGICYGMQLTAHILGGTVTAGETREFGRAVMNVSDRESLLFHGLDPTLQVWMSHGDKVTELPAGFSGVASSRDCPYAAMHDPQRKFYGVQFHPEVVHTPQGGDMLWNFAMQICNCQPDWEMASFIEQAIDTIRTKVGKGNVLLGLSGGVDSSVVAA